MESGLFYHQSIKRDFDLAEAAANVAEKEKPGLLKEAKANLFATFKSEFGKTACTVTEGYGGDLSMKLAPGVTVSLDVSSSTKDTKSGKAYARIVEINDAASDLCSIRCRLREMMDTPMVNKFKAYARSVYGTKPTVEQLEQAVKDFRAQHAPHTCPVKR